MQDQPRISRISVAVMVDGAVQTDVKGQHVWQPRNTQELERLTALTKTAIGFDQARGDVVTVMSMQFSDIEAAMPATQQTFLKGILSRSNEMEAARFGIFALCLLMVLFFVVRPLLRPPGGGLPAGQLLSEARSGGTRLPELEGTLATEAGNPTALLAAPYDATVPLTESDEETVAVSGVSGRIRASSVQRVVDLVETHPAESIALMRSWLMPRQEGH